ncbi:MAG: HD domain-containing protein [Nitrospirae bacterium]|nr:MAG: HD domain-containing protein [Nitrospirota bacterium]
MTRELLGAILEGYALDPWGIHGLPHWGRVLETGLRLAARTGADPRVVALFALFHDARRLNDGHDPDHGRRGAQLARRLRGRYLHLEDPAFRLLAAACTHHTAGRTEGDLTLRTCWDADRLDLWRVGIEPRPERLCTAAARDPELRAWARGRSLANHMPAALERLLP